MDSIIQHINGSLRFSRNNIVLKVSYSFWFQLIKRDRIALKEGNSEKRVIQKHTKSKIRQLRQHLK